MSLLEVKDLKVYYPIRGGILGRTVGYVKAVDGISFSIEEGKTFGLVGESGSGKSTTGKAIIGLAKSTHGQIFFDGEDITQYIGVNKSPYRRGVQMIFQDAYSSLNPKKRVRDIIAEPLRNFEKLTSGEEQKRVDGLLDIVGLPPETALKYPHEFSGGQRQRIGIARAMALKPKLIIADEPVSALDLSVQAQVLNYMKDIQEQFKLAYLFVSHDLGVVKHMCSEIAIMHKGRFVELGNRDNIYNNPVHIYTKRLISAIPDINPTNRKKMQVYRDKVSEDYTNRYSEYYNSENSVYDLKKIGDGHYVALP
ncbi:ABC transporter ATP-binding protein [Anaerocolumna sp. MB42-C2]|uniref:ABC transporter ATP-binding protein n=1 Tax=Anaerocolumna sp. MB42-C2 TaxID=3070997 RepID=UPI0027DFA653|nr:ATP-binding cassette domain-containing protein [Anaerocolumna sp. MB42-C2]WMJ87601.1 ATP-binding cassette domain-containing protein [Anaerocolumna sp. MB42-C2]